MIFNQMNGTIITKIVWIVAQQVGGGMVWFRRDLIECFWPAQTAGGNSTEVRLRSGLQLHLDIPAREFFDLVAKGEGE